MNYDGKVNGYKHIDVWFENLIRYFLLLYHLPDDTFEFCLGRAFGGEGKGN